MKKHNNGTTALIKDQLDTFYKSPRVMPQICLEETAQGPGSYGYGAVDITLDAKAKAAAKELREKHSSNAKIKSPYTMKDFVPPIVSVSAGILATAGNSLYTVVQGVVSENMPFVGVTTENNYRQIVSEGTAVEARSASLSSRR